MRCLCAMEDCGHSSICGETATVRGNLEGSGGETYLCDMCADEFVLIRPKRIKEDGTEDEEG